MFRKDKMTPYTSFASSSKGKPVDGVGVLGLCSAGTDGCDAGSFTATTTPELEARVLRGLLKADELAEGSVAAGSGWTARDTAGRIPPSTAAFGRLVRCQS
jgi:hypothetical protein